MTAAAAQASVILGSYCEVGVRPERAAGFLTEVAFRLVPQTRYVQTRADRQPALAVYARDDTSGIWPGRPRVTRGRGGSGGPRCARG